MNKQAVAITEGLNVLRSLESKLNFECGICSNFFGAIRQLDPTVKDFMTSIFVRALRSWPEYSGDVFYPIYHYDEGLEDLYENMETLESTAYFKSRDEGTLWSKDKAYGRARWRLYKWIISRFEHELSKELDTSD